MIAQRNNPREGSAPSHATGVALPRFTRDWSTLLGTTWRWPWGDRFRIHAVLWEGPRRALGMFIFDDHGRGPSWVPIVCLEHLMDGCEPVKFDGETKRYLVDRELQERLMGEFEVAEA